MPLNFTIVPNFGDHAEVFGLFGTNDPIRCKEEGYLLTQGVLVSDRQKSWTWPTA